MNGDFAANCVQQGRAAKDHSGDREFPIHGASFRFHTVAYVFERLALRQYGTVWFGMVSRRLTAVDWIKGAFRALKSGGIQAVRIEAIARELQVSKGSFYHHFKDLSDLQTKMIQHWEARATKDVIDGLEAAGGSARNRLELLIEAALSDLDLPYGGPGAEAAIRAWSFHNAQVETAQAQVDKTRLTYVAKLFAEVGHANDVASDWARLFLSSYLGSSQMPRKERADMLHQILQLSDGKSDRII